MTVLYAPSRDVARARFSRGRRPPIFSLFGGGVPPGLVGLGILFGNEGEVLTTSRASTKVVFRADGSTASVSNNQPGVDFRGLVSEEAHTNLLLWSRDLTNAAWTKSNVVASVGPGSDGVPGNGSILTATANDGFAAQAIVASGSRTTSVLMRRIAGAGTVQISRNGGANYTDVTSQVSSAWSRVQVNSTVTDPEIRIKLGSAGDSIGVDYVQDEAGPYALSPIATSAASATCQADMLTFGASTFGVLPATRGVVECWVVPQWASGQTANGMEFFDTRNTSVSSGVAMFVQNDTLGFIARNDGTQMMIVSAALSWVRGRQYRCRAVWRDGNAFLYRDDELVVSQVNGAFPMPPSHTQLRIGAADANVAWANAFISNLWFATQ